LSAHGFLASRYGPEEAQRIRDRMTDQAVRDHQTLKL
jgi:hypothetical protein